MSQSAGLLRVLLQACHELAYGQCAELLERESFCPIHDASTDRDFVDVVPLLAGRLKEGQMARRRPSPCSAFAVC